MAREQKAQIIEELKNRITQLEKLNQELMGKAASLIFPSPPEGKQVVDPNYINKWLAPYGIKISGGTSDWNYKLLTEADARRFAAWYHDNCPFKPAHYTSDERDCDDFAWVSRKGFCVKKG